jgi:hypothetical protein
MHAKEKRGTSKRQTKKKETKKPMNEEKSG